MVSNISFVNNYSINITTSIKIAEHSEKSFGRFVFCFWNYCFTDGLPGYALLHKVDKKMALQLAILLSVALFLGVHLSAQAIFRLGPEYIETRNPPRSVASELSQFDPKNSLRFRSNFKAVI